MHIEIDNCKIAYIETNPGADKTIFFIPGNSATKRIWSKQLESPLFSDYRLIAIDLPASGSSQITAETNYTLKGLAELIYKIVNKLIDGKPHIIAGVSLGTNIIAEMLAFEIRPLGLVLAGPCIFGANCKVENIAKPGTHVGVVFVDHSADEDVLSYAHEVLISDEQENIKMFVEDYKSVQPPFRSVLAGSIMAGDFNDEIALLNEKNIPALIVFGKDDVVVDCDYLDNEQLPLWSKTIYKIEGASHFVNMDAPEAFNKIVAEFAKDEFTKGVA